ncbi:hypothetical protein B0H63DRAFT_540712 [Podospora didyma]|uniref:Uncharacterized protein n=1 Tax=Podospora didyma TaxID=330526 RepID=A0AAE0NS50_9PEZI|nr:hypothetical protein B0H63DRAFT_540712 [Podospora didyma]
MKTVHWIDYDRWGACTVEFCRNLTWQGNADIAGIGVFVSYIVEVMLASILLAALGLPYIFRLKHYDGRALTATGRLAASNTWAALHTSLGTFWDTAFMFSFAVGVAGIVSTKISLSWYDRLFLAPSLALTSSVLFAAWPLYIPNCRHTTARWVGLLAILCMLGFLCSTAMTDDQTPMYMPAFDLYCMSTYDGSNNVPAQVAEYLRLVAVYGALGMGAALVVAYSLMRVVLFCWGPSAWPLEMLSRVEKKGWLGGWVLAWCVLLTGLMFANLIYFAIMRYLMFQAAGPSLRENRWGFGQVLALATWLPAVLDFVFVVTGHLKALEYRLPVGVDLFVSEKAVANGNGTNSDASDEESGGILVEDRGRIIGRGSPYRTTTSI